MLPFFFARLARISKQTKEYANTTGAAIAARNLHEEQMRNEWIAKHEREVLIYPCRLTRL